MSIRMSKNLFLKDYWTDFISAEQGDNDSKQI